MSSVEIDDVGPDDSFSGPAETWERWESVLVGSSIALGLAGLVVLGWLVDRFILP